MRTVFALVVVFGAACGATSDAAPPRTPPAGPASYFLAVELQSQMSQTFELVFYRITVDGRPLAERGVPAPNDAGAAEVIAAPACHRAMVQAGTHEVGIELRFRGHGFGVFSYLQRYTFDVRSTTRADVAREVFGVEVRAVAYEGGGPTTPLEERPAVGWQVAPHRDSPNAGCRPEGWAGGT